MLEKNLLPKLGNGNTIIFGCIVGSFAYGTNIEGSDVDKKWVYVQSHIDLFINGYRGQINISKDEVAYELSRFIELLRKSNPTVLEILYSPSDCILYKHQCFDKIVDMKKSFLTKACKFSFGGYAVSQIEKAQGLDKKMNWEKERTDRKSVLDYCYWISNNVDPKLGVKFQSHPIGDYFPSRDTSVMGLSAIPHTRDLYNLFWDARHKFKGIVQDVETSNDISLSDIPKDSNCLGMLYFNKDAYQVHCKEYRKYQDWLKNRNTQRYVDVSNHGQQIDGKNMLHCIRLIETALDMADFGMLIVRRENAQFLKEVRLGRYNLTKILELAKSRMEEMNKAFDNCKLPQKFEDEGLIKLANYQIRDIIYNETKQ